MKIMRIAVIGLAVIGLTGCAASYEDETGYSLPPELSNYKVVRISDGVQGLYVLVKKSNEDRPVIGTTRPGKYPVHTIVVDGETYIKAEKGEGR